MKNKVEIEIHSEKDCAWCEVNGRFIYGKNVDEVKRVLDNMSKSSEHLVW